MKRLADYDIDKVSALAEYLGISQEEIKVEDYSYDAEYETPDGIYTVMTGEEADEAHYNYIENYIDEFGISGFSEYGQEYIIDNCMSYDWFEDAWKEMEESYASDIATESDDTYGNRLVQECVNAGIIDDFLDDFEESDFDDIDEYIENNFDMDVLAEEYGEYLYNDGMEYYGNGYAWYAADFGEEEAAECAKKYCDLDIQAISDFCIDEDGYGNSLASWDGETVKYNGYYIFKQNG